MDLPTILATAAAALGVATLAAPTRTIETEIRIDAPPATVWQILTDGAAYPSWNPFIRSISGSFAPGTRLEAVIQPLGKSPMTFRPTVLVSKPGHELRWLGRLGVPRLFDGEHYFRLEPAEGGTRLIHGETFRGLLLWVIGVGQFRESFAAMNAALKDRAEAAPTVARSEPE